MPGAGWSRAGRAQTARAFFPENPFKQHYLDGIPANEPVTLYRCGSFIDLCRGPHVRHTGQVRAGAAIARLPPNMPVAKGRP